MFSYLTVKIRLVKITYKEGEVTVPSKTRNVALQCSVKEQTEMEQTRTAWPDFDYPMVLTLGAGIMEEMYSPHRKWLCALFSGGCSYLSVRKLI